MVGKCKSYRYASVASREILWEQVICSYAIILIFKGFRKFNFL